jgi:CO/xanthine dehydrogenase FAD-binding subunit
MPGWRSPAFLTYRSGWRRRRISWPSAELFAEAARVATAGLDPPADLNGSSEYRRQVAAALVRRGLQAAADNAYERQ